MTRVLNWGGRVGGVVECIGVVLELSNPVGFASFAWDVLQ